MLDVAGDDKAGKYLVSVYRYDSASPVVLSSLSKMILMGQHQHHRHKNNINNNMVRMSADEPSKNDLKNPMMTTRTATVASCPSLSSSTEATELTKIQQGRNRTRNDGGISTGRRLARGAAATGPQQLQLP
jgi:hypothetical protein